MIKLALNTRIEKLYKEIKKSLIGVFDNWRERHDIEYYLSMKQDTNIDNKREER